MADFLNNIKLDEFFDFKDKANAEIFKNAGFANYFREESVKSIFAIYLMGKKGMNLSQILEKSEGGDDVSVDELSQKEKKALGEAFLNDLKSRKVYGEVNGGAEQVKENLKWYGQMFSSAMDRISYESNYFPSLDEFSSAQSVCEMKDSPFMAIGTIASNFIMETSINFTRRSNRPTKNNNYGIDMGKEFIEGYGGDDKFKKDTNRLKAVSIVSGYAERVQEAVENNDQAVAVAALMAGQMACKFHDDIIVPPNAEVEAQNEEELEELEENNNLKLNDICSMDADDLMSEKMEAAAANTYMNFTMLLNSPMYSQNVSKFTPLLNGGKIGKKEDKWCDKIFECAFVAANVNVKNNSVSEVKNIIETINMNNNSELCEFDSTHYSKEHLNAESACFDNVFSTLIKSQEGLIKKAGKKDIFDNFKIDGMPLRKYIVEECGYSKKASEDDRLCKHQIIKNLIDKEHKVTFTPYKISDEDWDKVELSNEDIEIKTPANIAKVPYSELKGLRRDLEGIVEGYEQLKLIDSIFHINRKLFKNVKESLENLKTMTEHIYEKDSRGDTVISDENWKKIQKQFVAVSKTMEKYIKARKGASSGLGKQRLAKITSLYGNINAIRSRIYSYNRENDSIEATESTIRQQMYGNSNVETSYEEVANINWDKIKRPIVDDDYVNEYEYNAQMKDIYTVVKTEDEELKEKLEKNPDYIKQLEKKNNPVQKKAAVNLRNKMLNKIKKGNAPQGPAKK